MKNIQYTDTLGIPPRSMEQEFLCHKKRFEWWYATGFMTNESGKLFMWQYTLAALKMFGIKLNLLLTAVTDLESGRHYYNQKPIYFGRDVIITPTRVGVDGLAEMTFPAQKTAAGKLGLDMSGEGYALKLEIDPVKAPVWHCEDGLLRMGIDEPLAKTYYWSYTNLATSGTLVLNGETHKVKGKAWFDRQGGPFNPLDRRQQWEWFSFRFLDNEELMLFSFPHVPYQDGTYIDREGSAKRYNNYSITPLGYTRAGGNKFSFGWKVQLPGIKDEEYTVTPMIDGQLNLFFFELLAEVKNRAGKTVGYCVVELLPGVLNEKSTALSAFARV